MVPASPPGDAWWTRARDVVVVVAGADAAMTARVGQAKIQLCTLVGQLEARQRRKDVYLTYIHTELLILDIG